MNSIAENLKAMRENNKRIRKEAKTFKKTLRQRKSAHEDCPGGMPQHIDIIEEPNQNPD